MFVIQSPNGTLSQVFTSIEQIQEHLFTLPGSTVLMLVGQADGSVAHTPVARVVPALAPLQQTPTHQPRPQPAAPVSQPAPTENPTGMKVSIGGRASDHAQTFSTVTMENLSANVEAVAGPMRHEILEVIPASKDTDE